MEFLFAQLVSEKSMNKRKNKRTTKRLVHVFFWSCGVCFVLLLITYVVAWVSPLAYEKLSDKVIVTKLTFASLGILFGIFQVFLGILLALIGVTIEYDVDAEIGLMKLKLVSASPGILLLILGNILFTFSLMREFEVSEKIEARDSKQANSESTASSVPAYLKGKKSPK